MNETNDILIQLYERKIEVERCFKNNEIDQFEHDILMENVDLRIEEEIYLEGVIEDLIASHGVNEFKKRYNFVPLKNHKNIGYATINGRKTRVDLNINSPVARVGKKNRHKVIDKNDKESIHVFNMKETNIMLGKTPAKSYEWTDKEGKLVAKFHTFDWWDGKNIEDLKVSDQYKGRGYSYQLLDYATKELGVRNLAVDKTNTIAKHVYDKYGFKIVDQDDTRLYMKLEEKNNNISKM